MSDRVDASDQLTRPGRMAVIFVYLAYVAVVARSLAVGELRPVLQPYLRLELAYLILFTLVLWRSKLPGWLLYLYFVFQSVLVLWMISLEPRFDFVILLFMLLSFQASLFFSGWRRWIWVGILVFLTGGPLIYYLGLLQGLARSLTTMVGEIIVLGYVIDTQAIKLARHKSQELLDELQDAHSQLQLYAGQVEELASMQERNRLVRELHDTVSQLIFSISLTIRSAQLLLEKDPARVPETLKHLQGMTSDALGQLRSFITQLHPPQKS